MFCCGECRWKWHNKNRVLKPNQKYDCKVCGKHVEVWIAPSRVAKGINTLEYCSRTCAGVGRRREKHHQWKGGRIKDKDGYWMVKCDEHPSSGARGYVREHRLVMEKHIGRYLTADEVVHHINDDPSDNRIENLHLYKNNAEHKRKDIDHRKRDERGRLIKR